MMGKRSGIFLMVFLLFLGTALPATAAVWSGHEYKYVEASGLTWAAANDEATADGWYLATITSVDEMNFLAANVLPDSALELWLGGYQDADQSGTDVGWNWVTEETWGYTNWRTTAVVNEPNDGGNNVENNEENHLMLYTAENRLGLWNDTSGTYSAISGYVAERVVPVPGAFLMLGAGLIGLAGLRRNQG